MLILRIKVDTLTDAFIKEKNMRFKNIFPDSRGYFNTYGGRFVPETLMPILLEMEKAYNDGVEAEQQRCGDFDIENYC